ncbi:hypothetical protein HBI23_253380 [Parastagonospora nodorum]|nr:hypothetical protein HBI23_253380 [Parastagonospora nodorum]KAH5622318.1 hypothetical protein HBI51_247330 [Parastagonospora nodorum]KAH5983403.1 hypothetical protein HBI84_247300 [Parastagonospora nodorum]KAH6133527.1 hypothetical protein HBI68_252640 [Parastagonospora nodorum]KAH6383662.1 hypothetical protein HBI60_254830 [Parastagonospora nodorum]
MGVEKVIIQPSNSVEVPQKHDEVSIEYTGSSPISTCSGATLIVFAGWLYDDNTPDNKGKQFDSSVGRGDLITPIGIGRVIRGLDEGILGSTTSSPMKLGEKATLTISSDYAYSENGIPGYIPANATLIYDVEIKAIKGKKA